MPRYTFRLRTTDHAIHLPETFELPGLSEALVMANGAARALLRHSRGEQARISGTLDVEDERQMPVARLLLAEVARQIS